MADKHPYMSGSGGVTQLITQLRRSFPAAVTADTLRKLGIAPNNETYLLNILRFVGVLDAENKKPPAAVPVFNKHDDAEFQDGFAKLVQGAYKELFDLHGDSAWALSLDKLISFFRNHDGTSEVVGKRQATTFQTLARISGKLAEGATPIPRAASNGITRVAKKAATVATKRVAPLTVAPVPAPSPAAANLPVPVPTSAAHGQGSSAGGMGLTVRIEINLPPGGDQATYDAIFKSIRENLLNGNSA